MIGVLALVLMLLAGNLWADSVLEVEANSAELGSAVSLGQVQVASIGVVKLEASRKDRQLTMRAIGPGGEVIGHLETTVGFAESQIYVQTPEGLAKIIVHWGRAEESAQ